MVEQELTVHQDDMGLLAQAPIPRMDYLVRSVSFCRYCNENEEHVEKLRTENERLLCALEDAERRVEQLGERFQRKYRSEMARLEEAYSETTRELADTKQCLELEEAALEKVNTQLFRSRQLLRRHWAEIQKATMSLRTLTCTAEEKIKSLVAEARAISAVLSRKWGAEELQVVLQPLQAEFPQSTLARYVKKVVERAQSEQVLKLEAALSRDPPGKSQEALLLSNLSSSPLPDFEGAPSSTKGEPVPTAQKTTPWRESTAPVSPQERGDDDGIRGVVNSDSPSQQIRPGGTSSVSNAHESRYSSQQVSSARRVSTNRVVAGEPGAGASGRLVEGMGTSQQGTLPADAAFKVAERKAMKTSRSEKGGFLRGPGGDRGYERGAVSTAPNRRSKQKQERRQKQARSSDRKKSAGTSSKKEEDHQALTVEAGKAYDARGRTALCHPAPLNRNPKASLRGQDVRGNVTDRTRRGTSLQPLRSSETELRAAQDRIRELEAEIRRLSQLLQQGAFSTHARPGDSRSNRSQVDQKNFWFKQVPGPGMTSTGFPPMENLSTLKRTPLSSSISMSIVPSRVAPHHGSTGGFAVHQEAAAKESYHPSGAAWPALTANSLTDLYPIRPNANLDILTASKLKMQSHRPSVYDFDPAINPGITSGMAGPMGQPTAGRHFPLLNGGIISGIGGSADFPPTSGHAAKVVMPKSFGKAKSASGKGPSFTQQRPQFPPRPCYERCGAETNQKARYDCIGRQFEPSHLPNFTESLARHDLMRGRRSNVVASTGGAPLMQAESQGRLDSGDASIGDLGNVPNCVGVSTFTPQGNSQQGAVVNSLSGVPPPRYTGRERERRTAPHTSRTRQKRDPSRVVYQKGAGVLSGSSATMLSSEVVAVKTKAPGGKSMATGRGRPAGEPVEPAEGTAGSSGALATQGGFPRSGRHTAGSSWRSPENGAPPTAVGAEGGTDEASSMPDAAPGLGRPSLSSTEMPCSTSAGSTAAFSMSQPVSAASSPSQSQTQLVSPTPPQHQSLAAPSLSQSHSSVLLPSKLQRKISPAKVNPPQNQQQPVGNLSWRTRASLGVGPMSPRSARPIAEIRASSHTKGGDGNLLEPAERDHSGVGATEEPQYQAAATRGVSAASGSRQPEGQDLWAEVAGGGPTPLSALSSNDRADGAAGAKRKECPLMSAINPTGGRLGSAGDADTIWPLGLRALAPSASNDVILASPTSSGSAANPIGAATATTATSSVTTAASSERIAVVTITSTGDACESPSTTTSTHKRIPVSPKQPKTSLSKHGQHAQHHGQQLQSGGSTSKSINTCRRSPKLPGTTGGRGRSHSNKTSREVVAQPIGVGTPGRSSSGARHPGMPASKAVSRNTIECAISDSSRSLNPLFTKPPLQLEGPSHSLKSRSDRVSAERNRSSKGEGCLEKIDTNGVAQPMKAGLAAAPTAALIGNKNCRGSLMGLSSAAPLDTSGQQTHDDRGIFRRPSRGGNAAAPRQPMQRTDAGCSMMTTSSVSSANNNATSASTSGILLARRDHASASVAFAASVAETAGYTIQHSNVTSLAPGVSSSAVVENNQSFTSQPGRPYLRSAGESMLSLNSRPAEEAAEERVVLQPAGAGSAVPGSSKVAEPMRPPSFSMDGSSALEGSALPYSRMVTPQGNIEVSASREGYISTVFHAPMQKSSTSSVCSNSPSAAVADLNLNAAPSIPMAKMNAPLRRALFSDVRSSFPGQSKPEGDVSSTGGHGNSVAHQSRLFVSGRTSPSRSGVSTFLHFSQGKAIGQHAAAAAAQSQQPQSAPRVPGWSKSLHRCRSGSGSGEINSQAAKYRFHSSSCTVQPSNEEQERWVKNNKQS